MRNYLRFIVYLFVLIASSHACADQAVSFFRAVNVDNDRTVKELLAAGFDPNTSNPQGQAGLFLAMREGSFKVAEALLAHPHVRVDAPNLADETPLMMACLRGHVEWVVKLLDRSAALNRPGWTPLHYAASGPEPRLLGLLLDRGAELNAPSPNRSTPLMMAARYGPEDAADLLLKRGANAKLRNDLQLTAADFARTAGREQLALRLEAAAR
jgi:uncharacterized protein